MAQRSKKSEERRVIGMDISDRKSRVCEVGVESGEVLREWAVATDPEQVRRAFTGREDVVRIALEVGKQSPWLSRVLEKEGFEVVVANARKVRLIYQNRRKNDRVDAEYLARLARVDVRLLHSIRHRSESSQVALAAIRARDVLVRGRTQLINHVRGATKSMGTKISKCSAASFARRALQEVPPELQASLLPVIRAIQELSDRIRECERSIQHLIKTEYPECEVLRQVRGVGAVTALAFRLVIDNPKRFSRSRMVGAYLGLVPGQDDSGEQSPALHITKAGDVLLRRLLLQAANYILGPFGEDCDLRRHGERIAARGGKKARSIAKVAVARKLAVLLHRLWTTGAVYEPLRASSQQEAA
jgi:transposase